MQQHLNEKRHSILWLAMSTDPNPFHSSPISRLIPPAFASTKASITDAD